MIAGREKDWNTWSRYEQRAWVRGFLYALVFGCESDPVKSLPPEHRAYGRQAWADLIWLRDREAEP